MQGVCGIVLERNKAFLSFSYQKKSYLNFLKEEKISLQESKDFLELLKINSEAINDAIGVFEKKYSFSANKIFVELPFGLSREKEVSEKIVFSRKKKITSLDINSGKKYLEDKFLEWDERCIHHIILKYQVEGLETARAPLGFLAKKMKLDSVLTYVKNNFYEEVFDIFENLGRSFDGLVDHKLSLLSQAFNRFKKNQVLISVNNFNSYAVIKTEDNKITERQFDFSLGKMIEGLSKQYAVGFSLAGQLWERYGTFKIIPYSKEISIKKGDTYLNLSTKALSDFLKKIFSENLEKMLYNVSNTIRQDEQKVIFSFIGPLAQKEGFYGYLKTLLSCSLEVPESRCRSSALGCARYGAFKYLEKSYKKQLSLWGRLREIYDEYF